MRVGQDDQRAAYTARYGQAAWTRAVATATRQRHRAASEYHLAEHFTATEWLDLCARWDMRCPLRVSEDCTPDGPLTPHHRIELCQGGPNVIGNILPVCASCHYWIGVSQTGAVDCRDGWLEWQRGLCGAVKIGDEVFDKTESWNGPMTRTVEAILPPVLMDDAPDLIREGAHDEKQGGLEIGADGVTHWLNALILSSYDYDPEKRQYAYNLEDMVVHTREAWDAFMESKEAAREARDERNRMRMQRYERRMMRRGQRGGC